MVDVAGDLRSILAGDFGADVTLASGVTIRANPSVATVEDALGTDAVIAGYTRAITFATADAPAILGQTLTYAGQSWKVIHRQFRAQGNLTRAFLGAP